MVSYSSGGAALDTTATDIAATGAQAAGATGLAADAGHVHPQTGLQLSGLAALKASNLSDLASASTARTNLGLGAAALLASPVPLLNMTPEPETFGVPLAVGEGSYSSLMANNSFALVSGGLIVSYWTAATTQTAGHIITYTAGTAMTNANATLARIAVFAVNAATGALTSQLAITADLHTTLYGTTYAAYNSAFGATWSQVAGTMYAVGILVVCSSGLPVISGCTPSALNLVPASGIPPLFGYVTAQASMPASVVAGSLLGGPSGNQLPYFVMTP